MDAQTKDFLKGMIVLWSGSIASIPGGWALCDGNNGTPNLKNRFIVGAGATYVVDAIGGSSSHNHDFESQDHSHSIDSGGDLGADTDFNAYTDSENVEGTTDSEGHLPPFYALAYIMKL